MITGRLISGTIGFVIIILMLMVTFSSAANSIMVSELGGSKAFTADVVLTELSGKHLTMRENLWNLDILLTILTGIILLLIFKLFGMQMEDGVD